MKTTTTTLIMVVLLLTFGKTTSQTQNFGSITFNKAINISGKQRMLSQKISKSYLLMHKGVYNALIEKELNDNKLVFETQLNLLKKNASSSSTKLLLRQVENIWTEFKGITNIANQPVNSKNALRVMEVNTKLLNACHQVVLSIKKSSKYNNQYFGNTDQRLLKTINTSGKQRMLSQRLSLYYTAINLFPENKEKYEAVLKTVYDEFSNVVGFLLINSYNTPKSDQEMRNVMTVWQKYQSNKQAFFDGDFKVLDVYNDTNALTENFDIITTEYEKASKTRQKTTISSRKY